MNEVILNTNAELPTTVEGLNAFIIIGKERLNAQKAKIRAIEKTSMAVEAKEAALTDAQDMADILLDAEVKLGEILEAIPKQASYTGFSERKAVLPPDITHKQSHQAQTLSQNPHVVELVKETARQAGEIPTSAMVYKLVKEASMPKMKGAQRERDIASKVLKEGMTIKNAAKLHGMHPVNAREALHNYCRRKNTGLYELLFHSNIYADGWVNYECLPYLKELRLHVKSFLLEGSETA